MSGAIVQLHDEFLLTCVKLSNKTSFFKGQGYTLPPPTSLRAGGYSSKNKKLATVDRLLGLSAEIVTYAS